MKKSFVKIGDLDGNGVCNKDATSFSDLYVTIQFVFKVSLEAIKTALLTQ